MAKKILGLYVFIFGLSILVKVLFKGLEIKYFFLFFVSVLSVHMIILALFFKRKKFIIPGIILLLSSLFLFLYYIFFVNVIQFKNIWPVIGLITSISLVGFYSISTGKNPAIIIPGIFIGILSLILLFITLGLFKIRFMDFLLILISTMFIFVGSYFLFNIKIRKDHEIESMTQIPESSRGRKDSLKSANKMKRKKR